MFRDLCQPSLSLSKRSRISLCCIPPHYLFICEGSSSNVFPQHQILRFSFGREHQSKLRNPTPATIYRSLFRIKNESWHSEHNIEADERFVNQLIDCLIQPPNFITVSIFILSFINKTSIQHYHPGRANISDIKILGIFSIVFIRCAVLPTVALYYEFLRDWLPLCKQSRFLFKPWIIHLAPPAAWATVPNN